MHPLSDALTARLHADDLAREAADVRLLRSGSRRRARAPGGVRRVVGRGLLVAGERLLAEEREALDPAGIGRP